MSKLNSELCVHFSGRRSKAEVLACLDCSVLNRQLVAQPLNPVTGLNFVDLGFETDLVGLSMAKTSAGSGFEVVIADSGTVIVGPEPGIVIVTAVLNPAAIAAVSGMVAEYLVEALTVFAKIVSLQTVHLTG